MKPVGSLISILQECAKCGHRRKWTSQPYISHTPAGNLFLSAAMLFSGVGPTKFLRTMQHFGCLTFSKKTYFKHQKKTLMPAVKTVWTRRQTQLLEDHKDEPLGLGGDGRCDTPGHSAKYGTYTFLNVATNKILHLELVQSNEVSGSYHMEKAGLERGLSFLTNEKKMTIEGIVTDRHKSVAKFMREKYPEVSHRWDIWHVSKGAHNNSYFCIFDWLQNLSKLCELKKILVIRKNISHRITFSLCVRLLYSLAL